MRLWWHRVLLNDHALKDVARGSESPGNIHVSNVSRSYKIARYLGKYLSKGLDLVTRKHVKRYASSKGIREPVVSCGRIPFSNGAEVYQLRKIMEARGYVVSGIREYVVAGRRVIWMCGNRKGDPPKGGS